MVFIEAHVASEALAHVSPNCYCLSLSLSLSLFFHFLVVLNASKAAASDYFNVTHGDGVGTVLQDSFAHRCSGGETTGGGGGLLSRLVCEDGVTTTHSHSLRQRCGGSKELMQRSSPLFSLR